MSQQQTACPICGNSNDLINLDCNHPVCRDCLPQIKRFTDPTGTIIPDCTHCPTCRADIGRNTYERQGIPFPQVQGAPLYSMYGNGNQSPITMNQNSSQQHDNWNFSTAYLPPSPSNASNNNQNDNPLMLRAQDHRRARRPPFMDPHIGPVPPPSLRRRAALRPRNLNWAMAQALGQVGINTQPPQNLRASDQAQNSGGSKKRKINKKKRTKRRKNNKRNKNRKR